MITKMKINGTIQYAVTGIFGDGATHVFEEHEGKIADLPKKELAKLRREIKEAAGEEIFLYFETEAEARAYIQGVEDCDGWMGYCWTNIKEHEFIYKKIGQVIEVIQEA